MQAWATGGKKSSSQSLYKSIHQNLGSFIPTKPEFKPTQDFDPHLKGLLVHFRTFLGAETNKECEEWFWRVVPLAYLRYDALKNGLRAEVPAFGKRLKDKRNKVLKTANFIEKKTLCHKWSNLKGLTESQYLPVIELFQNYYGHPSFEKLIQRPTLKPDETIDKITDDTPFEMDFYRRQQPKAFAGFFAFMNLMNVKPQETSKDRYRILCAFILNYSSVGTLSDIDSNIQTGMTPMTLAKLVAEAISNYTIYKEKFEKLVLEEATNIFGDLQESLSRLTLPVVETPESESIGTKSALEKAEDENLKFFKDRIPRLSQELLNALESETSWIGSKSLSIAIKQHEEDEEKKNDPVKVEDASTDNNDESTTGLKTTPAPETHKEPSNLFVNMLVSCSGEKIPGWSCNQAIHAFTSRVFAEWPSATPRMDEPKIPAAIRAFTLAADKKCALCHKEFTLAADGHCSSCQHDDKIEDQDQNQYEEEE